MADHYSTQTLQDILGRWWSDAASAILVPYPSNGLSGALIWKVTYHGQSFCLRRWPREHPTAEDLAAIHGLLQHVARQGIDFVPVPLGIAFGDDHFWELAPWMPGQPYDLSRPDPNQRSEALRCLAKFHLAAQSHSGASFGPAPGLISRRNRLRELQGGRLAELQRAVFSLPRGDWGAIASGMVSELERLTPVVLPRFEHWSQIPLPLQMCLRDVKYDHTLFDGEHLVGLIDFGAVAIDSVAGDIARLVGSMVGDDHSEWPPAIDAYHSIRPLSADERRAIELFDGGGTVAASANWLQWLFIDGRQFPHAEVVRAQLDRLLARLRALQ